MARNYLIKHFFTQQAIWQWDGEYRKLVCQMAKKAAKPKKAKGSKAPKKSKASKKESKQLKAPKQSGGVFSLVLFFLMLEIGAVEAGLFFYFKGDLLYAMVDLLLGR